MTRAYCWLLIATLSACAGLTVFLAAQLAAQILEGTIQ